MLTCGQSGTDGPRGLGDRHQTGHGKIILGRQRRLHKTGPDQRHPHPFGLQIESQGRGQIIQGRLGGAIGLGLWQGQPADGGADNRQPRAPPQQGQEGRQRQTGCHQIGLDDPGKQFAIEAILERHVLAGPGIEDQQIQRRQLGRYIPHRGPIPPIKRQGGDPRLTEFIKPLCIPATPPNLPAGLLVIQRQLSTEARAGSGNQYSSTHEPNLPLMRRTTGPSSGNCS